MQDAESMHAFLKHPSLSSLSLQRQIVKHVFALPDSATEAYRKDDSGEHAKPRAGSAVAARNRIAYLSRSSHKQLLTGRGLAPLVRRFEYHSIRRLRAMKVHDEWTRFPDLLNIVCSDVFSAVVDSLCGTSLMKRNPGFARDFWAVDKNFHKLNISMPQFGRRDACRARDRALAAVKDWQAFAKANFTPESVDEFGDDPYWGNKDFRNRYDMFMSMDGYDENGAASQELAFLWG
jgi:hypothetical protein